MTALWKWVRPRRRFPPTRDGWYFLIATLLIGLAAINAGLNLLFLVWGMMLFLILASGVLSELCLRKLEVRRDAPLSVHADAPYLMGIALTNNKKRLPSFSVEVEDLVDGKPIDKRCYFLKLPAGRTQETAYRHVASRRGRLRLSGFRLSTRFPFGLIQKSKDVVAPAELLVYPALCPVPGDLLRGFASHHGRGEHKWRSRRGEFFGLREFRQGDDPRDIHWRTSARRGAPFLRETEDDEGQEVCLVVDNGPNVPDDPNTGIGALLESDKAFENMISLAASLACELLHRGYRVGMAARGEEITPEGGQAQATRLLRFLALVGTAAPDVPLRDAGRIGATVRFRAGHAPEVGFGGSAAAPRRIA
ncbi:MAG: DUF58 domain-containing protein [Deltaproteobacteria bacterium]|nr:DUF58 domain-containing protein [Deltaproteobacteria bacterium]